MVKINQLYGIGIALCFNLFDITTGLISAIKNKDIKSAKMRDGLFKKVGFIACYSLAYLVDNYGSYVGFNLSVKVLPIILLYTVTTELISIIENISKINPDIIPEQLEKFFELTDKRKEK